MRRLAITLLLLAGCDKLFGIDHIAPVDAPPPPPGYVSEVLADAPLGYFRLGEQMGVTAANEIDGAPSGIYKGNFALGAAGIIAGDTAIECDGVNCGADVGDAFDFPGLAPYTLEVWLKPTFDGNFHNVISKWQEPPAAIGYDLYYLDARLEVTRELSETDHDLVGYVGLVQGVYSHIVATFDGAKMRIYINGVEQTQGPGTRSLPDTTTPFMIASGNGAPTGAPVLGNVDEVAIYGIALPPERVAAHYQAAL